MLPEKILVLQTGETVVLPQETDDSHATTSPIELKVDSLGCSCFSKAHHDDMGNLSFLDVICMRSQGSVWIPCTPEAYAMYVDMGSAIATRRALRQWNEDIRVIKAQAREKAIVDFVRDNYLKVKIQENEIATRQRCRCLTALNLLA